MILVSLDCTKLALSNDTMTMVLGFIIFKKFEKNKKFQNFQIFSKVQKFGHRQACRQDIRDVVELGSAIELTFDHRIKSYVQNTVEKSTCCQLIMLKVDIYHRYVQSLTKARYRARSLLIDSLYRGKI